MSIVKDMSLAESYCTKIEWVRSFMPALSSIEERFARENPLPGCASPCPSTWRPKPPIWGWYWPRAARKST